MRRAPETVFLQMIDFNSFSTFGDGHYIPQIFVANRLVFQVANWLEVLKIAFYLAYKNVEGKEFIDSQVGKKHPTVNRIFVSSSRRLYSNPCKFCSDLYVFPRDNDYNASLIRLILSYLEEVSLYIVEATDIDNCKKETDRTIKSICKKSKFVQKNTKYYLAHINGECLSDSEKLFIKIEKEYDKKILLGDISITPEEELLLNDYMRNELLQLENGKSSFFTPEREKVFAFGLVRFAMKYYRKGVFWPHIYDEYGVKISAGKQSEINDCFRLIMFKTNKTYDDSLKQRIDNINLHSFVTDLCAPQFFDYLFDFWRLDLHRDVNNIYGDFGKVNFKLLLDELKRNNVKSISDIMKHTSKAIELNEKSCRLRIRRILKMIDDCFWNKAVIPKTGNRINDLLQDWITNPSGSFNKELKLSLRTKNSKGATLISKPQLSAKYQEKQFYIKLPREILPQCDSAEHPFWLIDFGGNNQQIIDADLFEGKACLYTEEKLFVVPHTFIFNDIKMILCSGNKRIASFSIKRNCYRFFKEDGKFVDYSSGSLPEGVLFCFSNTNKIPQFLYKEETLPMHDGDMFVACYNCENGNILSFDNKAMQVGDKLKEGLIGNKPINGVVAETNDKTYTVFANAPKILFAAEKSKVSGIGIIVNYNGKDVMHRMIDKYYYEFKSESQNDVYGYIVDLNDYLQNDGCYSVQISVPGSTNRNVFDFCYIKEFAYKFNSAPYVFVDCGSIEFDKKLNIEIDNDNWEQTATINRLTMNFDPENDDHCKKIKDWKLSLNYLLDSGAVQLSFDLPLFRWKFRLDDDWSIKQPSDINRKDFPSHIYVNGPFAFTDKSNKIFVRTNAQISDDGESDVYGRYEETGVCYSYRISNLKSWLTHDIAKCEIGAQFDGKTYTLFNVICRSLILSHSLSGDFDQSLLCGSFEILGGSEYSVSISKDGNIIEQDIPLVDGKFEMEMPLEEGDYVVDVYEIENDDNGFDSFSFKIGKFILKLVNLTELADVKICIRSARDNEKKYQPLFFTEKYYIKNLERIDGVDGGMVDGKEIVGLWSIDVFDQESIDSCIFYKGVCGYDMYSGKFKKEFNVLIIFYNKSDVNCIIVLRDDGDEYCELLYDKRKGWLLKDDLSYSGIERIKSITVLADDKYSLKTEIK